MELAKQEQKKMKKIKADYEKEQKSIQKFIDPSARKGKQYNAFLKKYKDIYAALEKISIHLDSKEIPKNTEQLFDKKQTLNKMDEIADILAIIC